MLRCDQKEIVCTSAHSKPLFKNHKSVGAVLNIDRNTSPFGNQFGKFDVIPIVVWEVVNVTLAGVYQTWNSYADPGYLFLGEI